MDIHEAAQMRLRHAQERALLSDRVCRELMLENEAGKHCAIFQINVRCAQAVRMNRIYHG